MVTMEGMIRESSEIYLNGCGEEGTGRRGEGGVAVVVVVVVVVVVAAVVVKLQGSGNDCTSTKASAAVVGVLGSDQGAHLGWKTIAMTEMDRW